MKLIAGIAVTLVLASCVGNRAPVISTHGVPQTYYQIEGFYVFPLKQVQLGQSVDEVKKELGQPRVALTSGFRQPNRVNLASLPAFDEQWGYFEGLANNWVFFKNRRVVAAFREESDF